MDKTKQQRSKGAHETRSKLWRDNFAILMPDAPNKDQKSRLGFYIDWLSEQGRAWYQPDLGAYRDYLLFRRARLDRQGKSKPATLSPLRRSGGIGIRLIAGTRTHLTAAPGAARRVPKAAAEAGKGHG